MTAHRDAALHANGSDDVPALELRAVHKRFGGIAALDGASLVVRAASVHALLGENGAGKTTLMRVAFGMVRPDSGSVHVGGHARTLASPADAMAAGLGMVHQHFALVPAMTVAENVALGGRGPLDLRAAARRVREIADATGLALDPAARVGELSVGAQQRVEIVKALAREARVLILDEPTAVLAPAEAGELLRWVRTFAGAGRSVVLISHKLREVLGVADEITVLRRGATAATMRVAEADERSIALAMLGAGAPPQLQDRAALLPGPHHFLARSDASPPRLAAGSVDQPVVLRADRVTVADARGVVRVRDATFEVRAGEIVGIAAVEGAGQRELLRALAGRVRPTSGTLTLPGDVGFVPEDRHQDALLLDFALYENVALRGAGSRRGPMSWPAMKRAAAEIVVRYDVRGAAGTSAPARSLSGGNQQKLVLGRELAAAPAALVVENPTRGLDIRAAADVHDRLRAARDAGTAVVLHSADLDEVLALADRVLAVFAGAVREVPPDRDLAGQAMLGVTDVT